MDRKNRSRLLACLMILAMLCTILPANVLATEGPAGGAAGAEATVTGATYSVTADSAISDGPVEISGPINTSQTWNDGDTVTGAVTITGGSDEANPVVITVTGSVNVQETVSVTGGYVKFTGGGTLLRNVANKDLITIGAGGTLELENITLDGDKSSFSSNTRPLIRVNNATAALVMNDGAVIQNHANTTATVNNGGTVLIAYGSFTMSGGTISDNLSDTQEVALYISSRNATVRLLPKAAILLQGALAKSSSASSKNVTITPVEGYEISSVTVDGSPRDAGPDGTYAISGFSTGLSVGVSTDPGSEPEPAAPIIGAQPAGGTYSVGDDVTLSIAADTSDGGTLSYQWCSNTTDSAEGGAPIDGATSPSYTPPTDTPGTTYYYCVVTNTLNGRTAEAVSSVAAVEVSEAAPEPAAVYLNGATGDDANDGATAETPVKTFARAKELLDPAIDGATIYITGRVTITGTETWSLAGYTNAKVQRASTFSGSADRMIEVGNNGNLTLENIVIDGNKNQVPSLTGAQAIIYISNAAAVVTIKEGTVLQNNNAVKGGAIAFNAQGTLNIYGGTMTAPDNGDTIYNNRPLANHSCTINIYPTSPISIAGSWGRATSSNITAVIVPQDRYEITSITANGEPLEPGQDGTYTVAAVASEGIPKISSGLVINVSFDLDAPVKPQVTGPTGAFYSVNDPAEPLNVTATVTDGGALSYQWYSNTVNSAVGGSPIDGATLSSYTPPTNEANLTYYYCVVTNTRNDKTATTVSGVAAVDIRTQLTPPALSSTPEAALSNSITLAAPAPSEQDAGAAIEYRRSANGSSYGNWQSNQLFTGLAASTDYYFQARYVAVNTAVYRDSEPSEAVLIKTDAPLQDLWICTNASATPRYTYSVWVNGALKGERVSPTDQSIISGTPSSPQIAKAGDTVKFIPYFDEGYGVGNFTVQEGGIVAPVKNPEDGSYTFTMPAQRAKIRIIAGTLRAFAPAPGIEHGSITIDGVGPDFAGGYVTVTAAPDPGYILKSVSHSDNGGSTWSTSSVEITGANTATIYISHTTDTTKKDILVKAEFEELAVTERSISSEAELRAFAEDVNAGNDHRGVTVTLTDNIPLTAAWTPIGTKSAPFKGTFNGVDHAITGLNVYYDTYDEDTCYLGLFGYVNAAVIENLKVSGTVTATDKAANYVSKDTSTVKDMTRSDVGGVVGTADNETKIKNCVSNVDVTACLSSIGGIVGNISKGYISDCINYGAVTSSKRNQHVGGIAGYLSGVDMERCGNYGDVTVTEETTTQYDGLGGGVWLEYQKPYGEAGGLVGWLDTIWRDSSIDSSFNRGNVVGWAYNMGGLVGYVQPRDNSTTAVTNCYNTGTVSMTAKNDVRGGGVVPVAGLVGDVYKSTGGVLELTNCYNAGALSQSAGQWGTIDPLYNAQAGANVTVSNCHPAGAVPEASVLGAQYKNDTQGINGGNPLLSWESDAINEERYNITFDVTPADATIRVFTDPARTQEVTAENGVFSLQTGQYFYAVSAQGYVTETGSFNVTVADRTISVAPRAAANVTFTVTPATADFTLTRASEAVAPVSSADGVYTFALYAGDAYTYTATADGYNGTTREYTAVDGDSITVTLTPSGQSEENPTIKGGQTISTGGVYNLGRNSGSTQGVITLSTTEPVTLVGTGVSLADVYENLYIKCTVAGVNLTLQDLYISNTVGAANMIDFMGADNHLYFVGVSILDMNTGATGYAMFHVAQNAELTIGGVTAEDTLYFYKREQGAGIGGNQGEYNGKSCRDSRETERRRRKRLSPDL